jgi:hypothetical protein
VKEEPSPELKSELKVEQTGVLKRKREFPEQEPEDEGEDEDEDSDDSTEWD